MIDAAGTGRAGARVALHPARSLWQELQALDGPPSPAEPPRPLVEVRSDAAGRFLLDAPEPGFYRLRVEASGTLPVEVPLLALTGAVELVPVAPPPAREVSVRVSSEGRPVEGARVAVVEPPSRRILPSPWSLAPRRARTDAAGRTTLPALRGESVAVEAVADGGRIAAGGEAAMRGAVELLLGDEVGGVAEVPNARDEAAGAGGEAASSAARAEASGTVRARGGEPGAFLVLRRSGLPLGRLPMSLAPQGRVDGGTPPADGPKTREAASAPPLVRVDRDGSVHPWPPAAAPSSSPAGRGAREGGGEDGREGRVVDAASGRGVGGALVWVDGDRHRFAHAAADGRFTLPASGLEPSPAGLVRAAAPGWQVGVALEAPGAAGTPEALEIALRGTGSVVGRVLTPRGEPVAGADLVAAAAAPVPGTTRDGGAIHSFASTDGAFRLEGLQPGRSYRLEASAPGRATVRRTVVAVAGAGDAEALVPLVLDVFQQAQGEVRDPGGEPLAGAEVLLTPAQAAGEATAPAASSPQNASDGGGAVLRAVSGPDGRFHLPRVAPGFYRLQARAPGFGRLLVPGVEVGEAEAGPADLGTLFLPPGVGLDGRVVDVEGEPVAAARVWVQPWDGEDGGNGDGSEAEPESTDDQGRFRVAGLADGEVVDLTVRAEGFLPWERPRLEVGSGELLEVVLEPASRVAGRVVDRGGEPVAGTWVLARTDGASSASSVGTAGTRAEGEAAAVPGGVSLGTTTGWDGGFVLDLPPAVWVLEARSRNLAPTRSPALELAPSEVREDVELVLEPGAEIAGTVTGPEGAPVPGATVTAVPHRGLQGAAAQVGASAGPALSPLSPISSTTGSDGSFELGGLPPGRQRVEVRHPGFLPEERVVESVAGAAARLDVRLRRGQAVRGRVVSGEGPLHSSWEVEARDPSGRAVGRVAVGADGRFELPGLAAQPHQLSALAADRTPVVHPVPVVPGEPGSEDLWIRVPAAASVEGRVTGLDLGQLARLEIVAEGDAGASRRGTVAYDGGYQVSGLAPGAWVVSATGAAGGRVATGRVHLAEGEVGRLDLDFAPGSALRGRVSRRGLPLRGADLALEAASSPAGGTGAPSGGGSGAAAPGGDSAAPGRWLRARTGVDGTFVFPEVPAGDYRLHVVAPDLGLHEQQPVRVPGAGWIEVELADGEPRGSGAGDGGETGSNP